MQTTVIASKHRKFRGSSIVALLDRFIEWKQFESLAQVPIFPSIATIATVAFRYSSSVFQNRSAYITCVVDDYPRLHKQDASAPLPGFLSLMLKDQGDKDEI